MNFEFLPIHTQSTTWDSRAEEQMKSHISKKITGDVLDVGCSVGITTVEMAQIFSNSNVYGVDNNESVLKQHPQLYSQQGWSHPSIGRTIHFENQPQNYSLICAKSPQLPFKDNSFELVCDMNNIYYSTWNMINSGEGSKGAHELENYFASINSLISESGIYFISGNRKRRADEELPYEFCTFEKNDDKLKLKEHSSTPTSQLELIIESILS
jgi:SAM-dependent methyltransferase